MRQLISAPNPESAPEPQWHEFERLARETLNYLSAGDSDDAITLRRQLDGAELDEINYTGAGLYVSISVSNAAPALARNGIVGDVHAEAPSSEHPLGILLFVRDGVAKQLEVFAYADWPEDISTYRCRYVRWRPTSDTGAVAENVDQRDPSSMWER